MIRILHLIEGLGSMGGAERRLLNDVTRLNDPFSHTVAYLFPQDSLKGLFQERCVSTIGLGLKGLADPRAIPRFSSVIRRVRPDLIHTQLFGADCYGRLIGRLMGVPVVSTVQSSVYVSPDPYLRSAKHEWVDRWTARTCVDRLVAVSEFVKELLRKRFRIADSRIQVIPNAVDPSPFERVDSQAVRHLREVLGISGKSKVLITVGKLNPPKGHRYVLEALASLCRESSDLLWLVVGEGISRVELEEQVQKEGLQRYVRFLGLRSDVPELLALSDLFVFPSLSEGLPFVLLEAMAAGKPCIGFRIGPMPEVIDDGKTGFVVEPFSSAAFTAAIRLLLTDSWRCRLMGEQARERVHRLFHADERARQLGELYRQVVG